MEDGEKGHEWKIEEEEEDENDEDAENQAGDYARTDDAEEDRMPK